jgi:glycerate 2-kinase
VRVLICPDKFAGTIGAAAAAEAISAGWASVAPTDTLVLRPLSDGGPGFLDAIEAGSVVSADTPVLRPIFDAVDQTVPRRLLVPTTDPLGRPVSGDVLLVGTTAYVESAQACGLHLLTPYERNPRITTSYGLGALVRAAADAGATEIVIGLGGSATNDAGAGFLAALGAVPVDAEGAELPPGGAALRQCAALRGQAEITPAGPSPTGPVDAADAAPAESPPIRLVGATDVDAPLTGIYGASAIFGPQKGASREDVLVLDAALEHFVGVLDQGSDLAARPGAGAAGGIGAAILALGGELRSGIGLVRTLSGLDAALDEADLVITGEGELDAQSIRGKVVGGVANAARDLGVSCVALVGTSSAGRRETMSAGVTDVYTLVDLFGSQAEAMARPAEGLRALAARLATQWSA